MPIAGNWAEDLQQVIALNKAVKPTEAESRLSTIIQQCPLHELEALDNQMTLALSSFLPKRRNHLEAILRQRREAKGLDPVGSKEPTSSAQPGPAQDSPLVPAGESRPARVPSPVATGIGVGRGEMETVAPAVADPHPERPVQARENPTAAAERPVQARANPPERHPVAKALAEIVRLNKTVQPAAAEAKFRALIESLEESAVTARAEELRQSIQEFLPKRRQSLTALLNSRLNKSASAPTPESAPDPSPGDESPVTSTRVPPVPKSSASAEAPLARPPSPALVASVAARPRPAVSPLTYTQERFSDDLDNLSKFHIFQWATFYRDALSEYFDVFLDLLSSADKPNQLLNLVRSALSHHARDIFGKGYAYVTTHSSSDVHYAITKSLAGLQRFLDLPLEFYSARLADAHHERAALRLRQLCSAMVFGILHGYAAAKFDQAGSQVLPRFPRSWAHVLPFLSSEDLRELATVLEPGDFVEGVQDSVLPLVQALDMFLEKDAGSAPLPALSQYVATTRRLDVSLQMSPNANDSRLMEIQCYMSSQFVDRHLIEEAAARAISAVVAPLRSDLRALVASVERLSDIVVPTDSSVREVPPHSRLLAVLEELVYENRSTSMDRPISFNFAADFPLENPFLTKYNHVYRISVRRLMQSYERRNGVRLWCSVRRSGKTTACASDLGSTTGHSAIVAQTCESTGQMADGGVFYMQVQQALDAGQRLDSEFVNRTVMKCLPAVSAADTRLVLVLDEYETLFGDLAASLVARPELRYTVVQPLLNQLVAFSRDNLLILMGQQPNAHYILMDQNQLSPVVEQDSFPLFAHEPGAALTGEFYELLRKVMTSHVEMDLEFVNHVYEETGGHPFLTVNLMVSFMDWLIAAQRPVSCLSPVRVELFSEFAQSSLSHTAILHNSNYDFFKAAASRHLSPAGRASDPWLYSVYSALRALALSSPESLSLPLDDCVAEVGRDCVGTSAHELLSTAARANFLTIDQGVVRPRIPLLARIASAVTPM